MSFFVPRGRGREVSKKKKTPKRKKKPKIKKTHLDVHPLGLDVAARGRDVDQLRRDVHPLREHAEPRRREREQRRREVEPLQEARRAGVRLGEHAGGVVEEGRRGRERRGGERRGRGRVAGGQDRVLEVEAREQLLAVGDLGEVAVRREHQALERRRGRLVRPLLLEQDLREDRGPVAVVRGELVGHVERVVGDDEGVLGGGGGEAEDEGAGEGAVIFFWFGLKFFCF